MPRAAVDSVLTHFREVVQDGSRNGKELFIGWYLQGFLPKPVLAVVASFPFGVYSDLNSELGVWTRSHNLHAFSW